MGLQISALEIVIRGTDGGKDVTDSSWPHTNCDNLRLQFSVVEVVIRRANDGKI